MKCVLRSDVECPIEDVYGACFFCTRIDERYVVSKVPILETELVYCEEEDE